MANEKIETIKNLLNNGYKVLYWQKPIPVNPNEFACLIIELYKAGEENVKISFNQSEEEEAGRFKDSLDQ